VDFSILKHARLKTGTTLLDYRCGNGYFVRYTWEHGVRAGGYNPYSQEFGDASELDRSYHFVTARDVLEHLDDPHALVDDLKSHAVPGGRLAIGTPNADAIDLHDALDLGLCASRTTATFPRPPNCSLWLRRGAGRSLSSSRTRQRIRWYR
jgi:hypothetical protein